MVHMVMVFIRVSHSCLLIKLGTIFNSVVATVGFKSFENHSLFKINNGSNGEIYNIWVLLGR